MMIIGVLGHVSYFGYMCPGVHEVSRVGDRFRSVGPAARKGTGVTSPHLSDMFQH